MPKKIVYLFGSGATHAVINAIDSTKKLLTSDIRDKIREDEKKIRKQIPDNIWNELMDSKVDIEHLISILESNYHYSVTQKIRGYYHNAIVEISKEFVQNIDNKKYKPNLYSVLFDLHRLKKYKEKVHSVITLNYEDLLERTLKSHLNIEVDYIIDKRNSKKEKNKLQVLKLHGSFNWKNTRLVTVGDTYSISSDNALWIPPGVEKEKENYPFNIIWGRAFECLMECDILRVIGCSLSRNDWGLIPMLYTAMRLTENKPSLQIEIVDFMDKGKKIQDSYPYLRIKNILEIPEFEKYVRDVYSISDAAPIPNYVVEYISSENTKINIFEMWLKAKGFEIKNDGIPIPKTIKYFSNFIK